MDIPFMNEQLGTIANNKELEEIINDFTPIYKSINIEKNFNFSYSELPGEIKKAKENERKLKELEEKSKKRLQRLEELEENSKKWLQRLEELEEEKQKMSQLIEKERQKRIDAEKKIQQLEEENQKSKMEGDNNK